MLIVICHRPTTNIFAYWHHITHLYETMRTTPIDFDVLPLRPEYLQPLAVWNFGHNTCTCVRSAPENYICNQSESNNLTGRGFPDAKGSNWSKMDGSS